MLLFNPTCFDALCHHHYRKHVGLKSNIFYEDFIETSARVGVFVCKFSDCALGMDNIKLNKLNFHRLSHFVHNT
jgi:hypothetical protein